MIAPMKIPTRLKSLIPPFTLSMPFFVSTTASAAETIYDIVIYGDSSGSFVASITAKRQGLSVLLISPTGFEGGMSASGLGATDFLKKEGTFGGIALEFYKDIASAYGKEFVRSFEPHVGRQVFEKMI